MGNSGMSLMQAEGGALASGLVNQAEAHGSVLGRVADNEAVQQKEYNPAFVLI